jgi:uncharacterized protein
MKHTRKRIVAALITLTTGLLFASTAVAAERPYLMGTSSTGTAGYASTMGFTSLISKYTPYKLEAVPTPGSTATARLFGKKQADFAYISTFDMSLAYDKKPPFEDPPLQRNPYQGMYYASFEIIALTKANRSDINKYRDMVGKKVLPNAAASGWHNLFKEGAQKMGFYDKLQVRFTERMQAADALKIGNLDVVVGYSTDLGELSVDWIKNIDTMIDIKIFSPSPEEQKELLAQKLTGVFYGEKMSYKSLTPGNVENTKKANPDGVWLWGSYQGWHPGSDMPTEVMYQMYKTWLEKAKEIADVNAFLEYWARDPLAMQVKAIDSGPKLPVHPGVAKYLKEKGVWKDHWTIGKLDDGIQ